MQVSFMLKEVEMTPCHLTGIVSRAAGATRRAAEAAAGWKVDADVEPARLCVKVAAHHFPRRRKPQRHLKQLRIPHRSRLPPSRAQRASVLAPVNDAAAPLRGGLRPSLTAAARAGPVSLRSGRRDGPSRRT